MQRLFFAIYLLASLSMNNVAADQRLPIDHFVHEDEYSNPRLSPDGKYLALTTRTLINDRPEKAVVVFSLPDMKEQSAVRMPKFEMPNTYDWVSNTRLLITKAKEYGSYEQPASTGEIFAMDFDGKNQEYIYGYNMRLARQGDKYTDNNGSGSVAGIPATKNGHFYMTTHLWRSDRSMLYDVDSKNASRKLITSIDVRGAIFVLQNDGTPKFAYGSNLNGFQQLYQYDAKNDAWNVISTEETDGYLQPFSFSPDDSEFYAFFRKKGEPKALIKQNTKTGERVTLLESKLGELDLILNTANHKLPFAFGSNIGIPSVQYLDKNAPEAKLHQLLSSKFQGNFIRFINYTDDGSKLLFAAQSDKEPGSYFIFDRTTNRAYPLFASRQLIDPDSMAERRPIQYQTRDGLTIYGFMTIPKSVTATKKMPLIVVAHGGPHGPYDHWFYDNDAQFLASRGYGVLQVNFRGSGGRGQAFEKSGYRKWGSEIQNDIIDGVKWAIKEMNVDESRMCTFGASFGGYSALMLPVREPAMFKCAIGYVGVYDLNLMFKSEEAKDKQFESVMTRYLGRDKDEFDTFSPAKQADKITIPVMLAHGMDDKRATFNHAEAMRDALTKQGRPPEWMAVPGEGHGFYNVKNRAELYQRIETFLDKHIGQ